MKTRSTDFILEKETAWQAAGDGVVRQIMAYDGQIMLVKVKFEKGAVGTVHSHFQSQASVVMSGKFEVEVDGKKQILSAGDSFYVAPEVPHGVICLEAGILIDTFTPVASGFSVLNKAYV